MKEYAILVNTTDSFEDCWEPFFILFKKFWPDYTGKLYLNTETKEYQFPGLDIISVKNGEKFWSECVRTALGKIEEDYVLYLQEDYFLKDYVKNDLINQYVASMIQHNIDCLHLTDQHSQGPFNPAAIPGLIVIDQKARDRISCQAAIWKKDVLVSYLREGDSGWHFETYGTMRSHFRKHNFYAVDHKTVVLNKYEIIPYVFTGIVKGQWWHEVKKLFADNHIEMDFSKRGFYVAPKKNSLKKRLIAKFKRQPKVWSTYWDIAGIILKNKG